jgi:predicted ribosomally synthesized peptide with SipW-like signal peptide
MSNMFLNIVSTFKGDGIKQATSDLGAFGKQAGNLGSTLGKVGAALAGFGLAAKAVKFTSESIDSARDLERNMYSLDTVFEGMAPTMEKFVKGAHEIGLSQKDAAKASTFLGSVLKQSGFSMADTTKQTQKLVGLGVDLATTYGYDVSEALLGMTALFRGEYDPIEKFGVAMKQSEINAELAARGQNNLSPALRRNAEQIVRMELLYERAADAIGAFTGQSGNLFVEQMKLQAQFENMQASIGTQLLPVMVSLTEALLPLIDFMGPKLAQAVNDSIPILQGFIAEIKNINDATTFTGGTIKVLTDIFGAFFSFITQNFGVLLAFTALIGGVTTALNLYTIAATFAAANPIAAAILILGSAFIIGANAASNLTTELEKNKLAADSLNPELNATAYEVEFVGGKMGILAGATSNATRETRRLRDELLLLQTVQGLSVYGGGKDLRSAMAADNRKKGSAAAQAAAAQNAAVAASAKAAQQQAAREQLVAQQQAAREQLAAQEQAARELADAQEQAFRTEEERLRKRADAYDSFSDSVKSIFGGIKESILSAFSLPDLGNSVGSITRNIKKLLEQTKNFARNINSLSQQGLTNDLLQQVIAAGPMQGGRLAASLAGAGAGFIGQLNQAYGEFGGIASGIAGVGTTAAFANREVINNYYQIEVSGGVGSGPTIGKAIVDAIKSYERTSGAVWQGA